MPEDRNPDRESLDEVLFRIVNHGCEGDLLNIQIFGTKKCNDTKKAERFFKERGIKYQFIDMKEKDMSKGELFVRGYRK